MQGHIVISVLVESSDATGIWSAAARFVRVSRMAAVDHDVDLVVNCFERTYRKVLAPGFFGAIQDDTDGAFSVRTALVNNVNDRRDAERRARVLIDRHEIDRVVFVADLIAGALDVCGLRAVDLGPAPFFTDFGLVAATLEGPDWFAMWDADVRLESACDWVSPAIELLDRRPEVMSATPNWRGEHFEPWYDEIDGNHAIGLGFSDQIFLGRRREFAMPIYWHRCIARRRYPMARVAPTFESRIDSYMRHNGRVRAISLVATYEHRVEMGTSWPQRSTGARLMDARDHLLIASLRRLGSRSPHLRSI